MFSEEEKGMIEEVFNNAIEALSDEDRKLPQVKQYKTNISRFKETVQFQEAII